MPKMSGENMGWWFNTSNTMSERPLVHVVRMKKMGRALLVPSMSLIESSTSQIIPQGLTLALALQTKT